MISGGKENVFKRNYIPLGKFKQNIKANRARRENKKDNLRA